MEGLLYFTLSEQSSLSTNSFEIECIFFLEFLLYSVTLHCHLVEKWSASLSSRIQDEALHKTLSYYDSRSLFPPLLLHVVQAHSCGISFAAIEN